MSRYDCTDFKVLLSAYLDGEIGPAERTDSDRHLLECGTCRTLLENAERTDSVIRALSARDPLFTETASSAIPLPLDFEQRVFDRTQRRHQMHWRRVYGSLGLLATAASIALGVALIYVVRANRDRGPDSQSNFVSGDDWEKLADGMHGPPRPPRWLSNSESPHAIIRLNDDELQALSATATTLASIVNTPFEDIAARERLAEIVKYDDLVERLVALRPKLDPVARRHVDATRATLYQLLRDRPELDLWEQLKEDLRLLDLPSMLESIAADGEKHESA